MIIFRRQNKYTIMGGIVLIVLLKLGLHPYVAVGLLIIYFLIIEAFLGKGTISNISNFGRSKRKDSDEDKDVGRDGGD